MGHKGAATITKALDTSQLRGSRAGFFLDWMRLDSEFFRQSDFRFVVNFLKATETGKGKPVDGYGTDFSDRRFVQGRPAAFFMDQRKHRCASWGFKDKPTKPFDVLELARRSMGEVTRAERPA